MKKTGIGFPINLLKKLPKKMLPPKVKIPAYTQGLIAGFNQYREKIIKILKNEL